MSRYPANLCQCCSVPVYWANRSPKGRDLLCHSCVKWALKILSRGRS